MSSLQDQLLKAGLVSKSQAQKIKTQKKKTQKAQRKSKESEIDESKLSSQKARDEKVLRDKQLNAAKQAAAEQKAIAAQVIQLIKSNIISKNDGELPYNFKDGTKIKKIFITQELQNQLTKGTLAIAKLGNSYELIPAKIAEKIAERDKEAIIQIATDGSSNTSEDHDDDPYADYKIPDDLMW